MTVCTVEECDRPTYCKGMCRKHYNAARWKIIGHEAKRGGKYYNRLPGTTIIKTDSGTVKVYQRNSGDPVDHYSQIHRRVRIFRGSASNYLCACGEKAREWSYIRGSEGEINIKMSSTRTAPASHDLLDYEPLCISCHRKRDYGQGLVL